MVVMLGIMFAMALLGWFFLSPAEEWLPYLPGLGQFVGSVVAIAALAWLAKRIKPRPSTSTLTRRWPLFLVGFGWGVWIIGLWIISENTRSTSLTLLWTGAVAVGLLAFSYVRVRALDPAALVGAGTLAAGTFLFWTLLTFVQELDNANRPDDTSGMALVGLVGLVALGGYLVYLARQWRQVKPATTARF